jgi:alpha-tubulin suppressor-like RCC1 family protein
VAGLAGVEQVASGRQFSCARLHDGAVRCWGSNEDGQLGDGGAPPRGSVRVAGLER